MPSSGHWWPYLYATIVLAFCLIICLIGSAMFARTSVIILLVRYQCDTHTPAWLLKNRVNFGRLFYSDVPFSSYLYHNALQPWV